MKNSLIFLILFVATILCSLVLPWWIVAVLSLAITYFAKARNLAGFFVPLAAVFLAWLLSIYFVDEGSVQEILGRLFGIPGFLTPAVASLVGGLVAGLFGLAGALLAPKPKKWVNG